MSYIFSQALVEASSLGKCLDTEPCALLSGTHTPNLSLWHDRTMDVSRHSRYGMTCRPLTDDLGAELLTSWLAGFRAKTSALQEKAQESTGSAAECGRTWRGWLAKYDPSSCSWKTAQQSFIEDSGECLATFPRSGMTRGGLLWELPMLERRTSETGSGCLLPTPVSIDAGSGRINKSASKNAKERPTLALMARKSLWPTPTVCGNYNRKGVSSTSGDGLATAIRMFHTPTTGGLDGGSNSRKAAQKRGEEMPSGGALNPSWVEWLMGWPIGHTDLKRLETAKCPNALPKPSEFLLEVCE